MQIKFGQIRGPNCVIEIDETAVTKRKFDRDRRVSTLWCVGGVCRVYKSFSFELTKKPEKETLQRILFSHIDSRSQIITDEWHGYWGHERDFKAHKTLRHKRHFVDPKNPKIHSQNIECLWKHSKKYVKGYGSDLKKTLRLLF